MSEITPKNRDTREKLGITEAQRQEIIAILKRSNAGLTRYVEHLRHELFE